MRPPYFGTSHGWIVCTAYNSPSAQASAQSAGSAGVSPVHSVLLATFPLVRGFPFCAGGFHAFAKFLSE